MGITVALTGSSGNMGRETLPALLSLPFVDKIKLLYLNNNKERKFARKIKKSMATESSKFSATSQTIPIAKALWKTPTTSSILPRSFRPIPTTRPNLRAPATLRAFRTLWKPWNPCKTAEIYPYFDCRGLRKQELSAPVGKGRRSAFAKRLRRLCRNEGKRRVDRAWKRNRKLCNFAPNRDTSLPHAHQQYEGRADVSHLFQRAAWMGDGAR